jgi:hypothetical protein
MAVRFIQLRDFVAFYLGIRVGSDIGLGQSLALHHRQLLPVASGSRLS